MLFGVLIILDATINADSSKPILELYSVVDASNYETPVSTMRSQVTFYVRV